MLIPYLVVGTVLLSEFGAYLWHRYSAHTDLIPGVGDTHHIHHTADLTHEAHEDFYWIIIILLLMGLFIIVLKHYINIKYMLLIYGVVTIVFIWNWYIHSAYHIPNHWLNTYEWFRRDKHIHLQHHVNPDVNYGIASHFSDVIFGTYEYPYSSFC